MSDSDVDYMLEHCDADHSGTISYEEVSHRVAPSHLFIYPLWPVSLTHRACVFVAVCTQLAPVLAAWMELIKDGHCAPPPIEEVEKPKSSACVLL